MVLVPITDSSWPVDIASMKDGFAGKLNVYRVMAHNPALLSAWETLRNHIVLQNSLPDSDLEIVILRAGHRRAAPYEWAHHVIRGRKAGLDDRLIEACRGPAKDFPDPTKAVLLTAVDELALDNRLGEPTLSALTQSYDPKAVLDIIATVGMYTTLAYIVNSFSTPIDDDIRAALAAAPLQGAE